MYHSRAIAFVLSDDVVPWSTLLFKLLLLESSYLSMRTCALSSPPPFFSSKTPGQFRSYLIFHSTSLLHIPLKENRSYCPPSSHSWFRSSFQQLYWDNSHSYSCSRESFAVLTRSPVCCVACVPAPALCGTSKTGWQGAAVRRGPGRPLPQD